MYTPHTVSLINQHGDDLYLTILRGVMVQDLERRSVLQAGDYDASYTKIYIPFAVEAKNTDGEPVTYLPPKQYAKSHAPQEVCVFCMMPLRIFLPNISIEDTP